MKDKISIERIKTLHPSQIELFTKFIEHVEKSLDITLRVVCAFRTAKEQDYEYSKGRTNKNFPIVTAARAWESYHCFGFAIDAVPLINGKPDWKYDFSKIAAIAKIYGISWGGAWKDYDHFENDLGNGPHGWKYLAQLRKDGKVDEKGFVII